MPEMRFDIVWPDGSRERCYSPSLVVRDHLAEGEAYTLDDFLARCRVALGIASDRVREKYGFPCSRAIGQLARIEQAAARFAATPGARVTCAAFILD
ncbi:MAG: MSMEG_0570 family nitrogen starvation response protein [Alsobacter sp.]